jgi:hypothetical protein
MSTRAYFTNITQLIRRYMTKEQKKLLENAVKRFGIVSVEFIMRKFKMTHDEATRIYELFKKAKLVK